jgi:transcriptional regulator with XRE-family HTH domain
VPSAAYSRREPARAGTLSLIARAAAHDRVSAALRKARERAELTEQQVIDLMGARGVSITAATIERWERTGGIRLEEAVDLAAVYHLSLDELAGRRAWHSRFHSTLERPRADAA